MKETEQAYDVWESANEGRLPFFSLKSVFILAYQIGRIQGIRQSLEQLGFSKKEDA
jgi:TRAP-type mannitol/chloroaromatic compound transport system permease small subunit